MDRAKSILSLETLIRDGDADKFDTLRFLSLLEYKKNLCSLDYYVYTYYRDFGEKYLKRFI